MQNQNNCIEDNDEFDDLRNNEIVSHWKNVASGKKNKIGDNLN